MIVSPSNGEEGRSLEASRVTLSIVRSAASVMDILTESLPFAIFTAVCADFSYFYAPHTRWFLPRALNVHVPTPITEVTSTSFCHCRRVKRTQM